MPTVQCPSCAHHFTPAKTARTPKPAAQIDDQRDTADMSDAELVAYRAATAHVGDVRFHLAHAEPDMQPAMAALLVQAEHGLPKAATRKALWALQQQEAQRRVPVTDEAAFWAAHRARIAAETASALPQAA